MTFIFMEGVTMSDPIPKDGGTEAGASEGIADEPVLDRLPPADLPEELLLRRLGRLDTRRALAEICRNVPGLEEALLPRGIQADALTRKSGGGAPLLRGIARRISHDAAAWGRFAQPSRSRSHPRPSKPWKVSPWRTWKNSSRPTPPRACCWPPSARKRSPKRASSGRSWTPGGRREARPRNGLPRMRVSAISKPNWSV